MKANKHSKASFDKSQLEKVFHKLPLVDQMKLSGYINAEVERVSKITVYELCSRYNYMVDSAIMDFFDCGIEEIDQLKKVTVEYREDFEEVVNKFKNDKEYEKYMSEIQEKLIVRIDESIKKGMKQNEALKALKKEFDGVSKATIITTYKARKSELRANGEVLESNEDTEALAEYILSEKEEVKEEKASKFRVEYKEIVVTGETGTKYIIKDNKIAGMTIEELIKSLDKIESEYKEHIKNLENQIEVYKKAINDNSLAKNEAIEVAKEFLK